MGVVNEGGTRAECEEGRAGGCGAARHVCAHLEVLQKKPVPAAVPLIWTAWLVTPRHSAMQPPPFASPSSGCMLRS